MKTITEKEFRQLMNSNEVLVVQFSATWCGPCKSLTKTIEQNEDKFINPIYKMDVNVSHHLANMLRVQSVPTIIRFENTKEVKREVGLQTFEQLQGLTV